MKKYDISFFLGLLLVVLLFFFHRVILYKLDNGDIGHVIDIAEYFGVDLIGGVVSVESVVNFLYFNLFISICMFLSAILLIYFFKKENNRLIIITVIIIYIFSYISYFLVCNLGEDISMIYIINHSLMYPDYEIFQEEGRYFALDISIIISTCILRISSLFMIMYISYTVIYRNCNILFLKRIIGEGFYSYFMKIFNYVSKINL